MILKEPFFGEWFSGDTLGSGAFGTVYSIYRNVKGGDRIYAAMKVLRVPRSSAEVSDLQAQGYSSKQIRDMYKPQLDKLRSEIEILSRLRGEDHIVIYEESQIVEDREEPGWEVYIRMEKLERLDDYLKRKNATIEDILNLWLDMAVALITVHKKGIIHRDIKPENILVARGGMFKLVDFGIARHLGENSFVMTKAGTYPYMAPEVNRKDKYDRRADIYSLGLVIYRLFNHNRYPFLPPYPESFYPADRDEALQRRFSGERIPKPAGLPEPVWRILSKSIEFDPEDRYDNAGELYEQLRNLRLGRDIMEQRVELVSGEEKSDTGKKVMLIIALLLLALVLLGAAYLAIA